MPTSSSNHCYIDFNQLLGTIVKNTKDIFCLATDDRNFSKSMPAISWKGYSRSIINVSYACWQSYQMFSRTGYKVEPHANLKSSAKCSFSWDNWTLLLRIVCSNLGITLFVNLLCHLMNGLAWSILPKLQSKLSLFRQREKTVCPETQKNRHEANWMRLLKWRVRPISSDTVHKLSRACVTEFYGQGQGFALRCPKKFCSVMVWTKPMTDCLCKFYSPFNWVNYSWFLVVYSSWSTVFLGQPCFINFRFDGCLRSTYVLQKLGGGVRRCQRLHFCSAKKVVSRLNWDNPCNPGVRTKT